MHQPFYTVHPPPPQAFDTFVLSLYALGREPDLSNRHMGEALYNKL